MTEFLPHGMMLSASEHTLVLYLGMPPNDLKLFTAILVMLALAAPMIKGKVNIGKAG